MITQIVGVDNKMFKYFTLKTHCLVFLANDYCKFLITRLNYFKSFNYILPKQSLIELLVYLYGYHDAMLLLLNDIKYIPSHYVISIATKLEYFDVTDILIRLGLDIQYKKNYILKWAISNNKLLVVEYIINKVNIFTKRAQCDIVKHALNSGHIGIFIFLYNQFNLSNKTYKYFLQNSKKNTSKEIIYFLKNN